MREEIGWRRREGGGRRDHTKFPDIIHNSHTSNKTPTHSTKLLHMGQKPLSFD